MSNDSMILLIALIGALLALIVAILALLKALKANERTSSSRIKEFAREEYNIQVANFLDQRLKIIVHDELVHQQSKKEEPIKPTPAPVVEANVNPTVAEEQQAQPEPAQAEKGPVEIVLPTPKTWYTGSYTTGSFRHVSPVPDDKTIFTIFANSEDATEGILNIDQNAYAKVAQTPDYLEKACTWSGMGTRVKVVKIGTVIKEGGSWVVKDPIVVEFN